MVQHLKAILAQLVEHLIRNQAVGGSNPLDGSIKKGLVSLRHKPFLFFMWSHIIRYLAKPRVQMRLRISFFSTKSRHRRVF